MGELSNTVTLVALSAIVGAILLDMIRRAESEGSPKHAVPVHPEQLRVQRQLSQGLPIIPRRAAYR